MNRVHLKKCIQLFGRIQLSLYCIFTVLQISKLLQPPPAGSKCHRSPRRMERLELQILCTPCANPVQMCKCANLVQMCLLLNIVAAAAASAAAELCSVYLQFTVSRLVGACSAALCRQACSSWAAEELSADLTLLLFLTHNHPPGCHSS